MTLASLITLPGASMTVNFHSHSVEEATTLRAQIGGRWEKNSSDGYYWLTRELDGATINIFIPSMCERVEVGTIELPAVPALPARTIPQYEYRCKALHEAVGK